MVLRLDRRPGHEMCQQRKRIEQVTTAREGPESG